MIEVSFSRFAQRDLTSATTVAVGTGAEVIVDGNEEGFASRVTREAVDCAHEGDADGGDEVEPVDGVAGEGVAIGEAVVYEGEEPDEDVGEGVDEHEAELAVDAEVLLGELTFQLWGGGFWK